MLERMHAVVQQAFGGPEVLEVAEIDRLITIVGRRDVELAARTRAAVRRFAGLSVEPDYPGLEALARLVDSGQLRVHLQTTLPLAAAARGHQLLESGRTTGKVVLTSQ